MRLADSGRRTHAMKRDGNLEGHSSAAGVEVPDIERLEKFREEEDFISAKDESIPVRIAVPIVPVSRRRNESIHVRAESHLEEV